MLFVVPIGLEVLKDCCIGFQKSQVYKVEEIGRSKLG